MGVADPTMAFLLGLNDESKWIINRNVPIFTAHTRKNFDKEGKPLADTVVTDADVDEYAAETFAIERDYGVCGRITEGHVKPGVPEKDQPDLLGVYRNARTGTFGPKGTKAVLVDEYIRRDKESVAKNRPYRSPEVYHGRKQIRGLARLISDPFLDLGIVTSYAADLLAAWTAAPEKTMSQTADTNQPDLYAKITALEAEVAAAKSQAATLDGQLKIERDARLAGEKTLDNERCVALVNGLVAMGYALTPEERAEEVAELLPRDAAGRTKYVEKLKKTYAERKAPTGPMIDTGGNVTNYTPGDHTTDPTKAPPKHDEIMAYMRAHEGMSYDTAKADVLAGKK